MSSKVFYAIKNWTRGLDLIKVVSVAVYRMFQAKRNPGCFPLMADNLSSIIAHYYDVILCLFNIATFFSAEAAMQHVLF